MLRRDRPKPKVGTLKDAIANGTMRIVTDPAEKIKLLQNERKNTGCGLGAKGVDDDRKYSDLTYTVIH